MRTYAHGLGFPLWVIRELQTNRLEPDAWLLRSAIVHDFGRKYTCIESCKNIRSRLAKVGFWDDIPQRAETSGPRLDGDFDHHSFERQLGSSGGWRILARLAVVVHVLFLELMIPKDDLPLYNCRTSHFQRFCVGCFRYRHSTHSRDGRSLFILRHAFHYVTETTVHVTLFRSGRPPGIPRYVPRESCVSISENPQSCCRSAGAPCCTSDCCRGER
jgi:hypothetical protein